VTGTPDQQERAFKKGSREYNLWPGGTTMFQKAQSCLVFSLLSCVLALSAAGTLNAQAVSNATVTGRVVDEQGAVVSGARIRMTPVNTGAIFDVVANAVLHYP
jgi:hypothetical protein